MAEPRVVIVTGLSGAGRSTTAAVLEDVGYFVVDNLPPPLILDVVDGSEVVEGGRERLAIVVDTRGGLTAADLDLAVRGLLGRGLETTVLFLDASDQALIQRYEETRRAHPVRGRTLAASIANERATFEEIRAQADVIVDTTGLNVHELRQRVQDVFAGDLPRHAMRVDIISFGYKRGIPRVVDLMFDVRFLPNPHWIPELRPHTGLDVAVREYVLTQDDAAEFMTRAGELLEFLIPRYTAEGKAYLTIGVGCTGGRHRSVVVAEALGKVLEAGDVAVAVSHRDLEQVDLG